MSTCMSKMIQGSGLSKSMRIDEDTMFMQKQGIVTILGSDFDRNIAAAATSLRRTLSADMSSKKWLSQAMKKTSSSEELSHSNSNANVTADHSLSSSDGEDNYEEMKELVDAEAERQRLQIWSSIQRDNKEHHEKTKQFDTWNLILSNKANDETSKLTTPYIHPLVRRSKSCLNQKSLEICTESLGSETGSDGFSSYPPSETGDSEEDKEEVTVQPHDDKEEELQVPKYNYAVKKSLPRSFPPPLPSLSYPSLHMRSHRDNGRLFLQAVSVPSQNNFCAQRQEGRLVLTFATHHDEDECPVTEEEKDHVEELEEEFVGFEEDDDEAGEEVETVIEEEQKFSSGIPSVHGLALMMNKPIGLVNKNPKWSEKFNEVANFVRSTPAAFNAYEYYWRTKPTAKAALVTNSFTLQQNKYSFFNDYNSFVYGDIKQTSNERQQLLVLRGKNGDYLVHNLKSCKDSRRPFLFWEPYCIAT